MKNIDLQLTVSNLPEWVSTHLQTGATRIKQLSGGVSGVVLLVETTDGRVVVVKQALPQLQVHAQWFCDPRRAMRESAALRLLGPLLPEESLPALIAEDVGANAFAMTAAPAQFHTWKSDLLAGVCSVRVAARVGELLRGAIESTADNPTVAASFADLETFEALRLQPYYGQLASRYPDLQVTMDALSEDCRTNRLSVVHGDFSPKNLLTDGSDVMVIDWECVHFGQPGFDVAFLLNHLLLKSFHRPESTVVLRDCADAFWHQATDSLTAGSAIRSSALRHLPALLLARVDGKSPAEYINTDKLRQQVRLLAMDLLRRPAAHPAELFERRSDLCP